MGPLLTFQTFVSPQAHHKSRLWLKDCTDEQNQGVRMNAKVGKIMVIFGKASKSPDTHRPRYIHGVRP